MTTPGTDQRRERVAVNHDESAAGRSRRAREGSPNEIAAIVKIYQRRNPQTDVARVRQVGKIATVINLDLATLLDDTLLS